MVHLLRDGLSEWPVGEHLDHDGSGVPQGPAACLLGKENICRRKIPVNGEAEHSSPDWDRDPTVEGLLSSCPISRFPCPSIGPSF